MLEDLIEIKPTLSKKIALYQKKAFPKRRKRFKTVVRKTIKRPKRNGFLTILKKT